MNLTQLKAVQSRIEKFINQVDQELTHYQESDFNKLNYEDDRKSFRRYLTELNDKRAKLEKEWYDVTYQIRILNS